MAIATHPGFPTLMTADEAEAGFTLACCLNPDTPGPTVPSQIYVLVKTFGPRQRVAKVRTPEGGVGYVHQEGAPVGIFGAADIWTARSPVLATMADAFAAARAATDPAP